MASVLRILFAWVCEIALVFVYPLAGLLGSVLRPSTPTGGAPTLVWVAGWLTAWPLYWASTRHLKAKGYRVLFPNLHLQIGDLSKNAARLERYVRKHGLQDIILVGASA